MATDIKPLIHNQLSELIAQAQVRQAELKKGRRRQGPWDDRCGVAAVAGELLASVG